jgi:hypothetical protein
VPSGGRGATEEEIQWLTAAFTNTKNLQSYHAHMIASGGPYTATTDVESDFVAPDNVYVTGMLLGAPVEQLASGGTLYKKENGQWVPDHKTTISTTLQELGNQTNVLLAVQIYFAAGTNYRNLGTEPQDGVPTTHFSGDIDVGKLLAYLVSIANGELGPMPLPKLPPMGTLDVWVDPNKQIMRRIVVKVNSTGFDQFILGQMPAGGGNPLLGGFSNPLPGAGAPTRVTALTYTIDAVITRPDDPTISVPQP